MFKKGEKMVTRTECEEAINEICKKCFEKHELEYGYQPVNCVFRAFDNEDCPMVTVLRKLIQEHFDEKEANNVSTQMCTKHCEPTEQEKQVEESFEEKVEPYEMCSDMYCDECAFHDDCYK